MTSVNKEHARARAEKRRDADPAGTLALGLVLLQGMEEITTYESWSGGAMTTTYYTYFTLPDGSEWKLALTRSEWS